jgi:hypothetical protein
MRLLSYTLNLHGMTTPLPAYRRWQGYYGSHCAVTSTPAGKGAGGHRRHLAYLFQRLPPAGCAAVSVRSVLIPLHLMASAILPAVN